MKVIGCGSIPTITLKMTIGSMHKDGNSIILTEKNEEIKKPFWAPIPKHVADKLEVGQTVVITCVPVVDLSFATETLSLKKFTSAHGTVQIYDRGGYAEKEISMDVFQ